MSDASAAASARVSFFDEQAKRRKEARVWSGVALVLALGLGWVLGFLVLSAALFYAHLLGAFLPRALERAIDATLPSGEGVIPFLTVGGLVVAAGLWVLVRAIFRRDLSGGLLGRVAAREARADDPEERQLAHVVEEMAIAATLPPPRLWLFDGEVINAAALGSGPAEASLLVSRRMLDSLDRDETQGVIAHLVATCVNDDLRVTAAMMRALYAMGLAVTLLDLPFSARARDALRTLVRYLRTAESGAAGSDAAAVGLRLTASLQPEGLECLLRFMQRVLGLQDEKRPSEGVRTVVGSLVLMPLLPLIMLRIAAAIVYGLLSLLVLGPVVSAVLRSRRRVADATAVQLTRNPDGLGCALVRLTELARTLPGAGWGEMLFIVGPEAADARRLQRLQERLSAVRGRTVGAGEKITQGLQAAGEAVASPSSAQTEAQNNNFVFGFHPSLGSRIARLRRMGATKVEWVERKDHSGWILAAVITLVVGLVVLLAVAGSRK